MARAKCSLRMCFATLLWLCVSLFFYLSRSKSLIVSDLPRYEDYARDSIVNEPSVICKPHNATLAPACSTSKPLTRWTMSQVTCTVVDEVYLSTCRRWGVSTIKADMFSVSISRFLNLDGWCVVIVYSDKTPPDHYQGRLVCGEKSIVYLNSTTKNAGYMYAIAHGATVIWDFDDDHMIKFWIKGAGPPGAPSLENAMALHSVSEVNAMEPKDHTWPTYNPYPALGAPVLPSWPRGLPLDDVRKGNCSNTEIRLVRVKSRSIAVLQSLSDYRPDADEVYSSCLHIPFFFDRINQGDKASDPTRGCIFTL